MSPVHDRCTLQGQRQASPSGIGVSRILLPLLLGLTTAVSGQQGRATEASGSWPTAALNPAGTRHSPLEQIAPANVGQLEEAWRFRTGVTGPHEGAPLVVGATMYLHTPHPNRVVALSLDEPGTVRWRYAPPVTRAASLTGFRDSGTRGLAWHPDGIVFVPITTGYLAALDARTGREIWRVRNADARQGGAVQSAPVVIGDVVVIGMAGSEYGLRGYLSGYRAENGELLWRAYTTGPDTDLLLTGPANSQYPTHSARDLGVTTWAGATWQRGGGTTDGALTWDASLQLVYHGTGAPAPWNAVLRPGDNKWTSSIIARDVTSGRLRWAFQLAPHDPWGYGAEGENILADLTISGREIRALIHVGRNGFIYVLDRTNGRLLLVERGGPANWAAAITPGSGLPTLEPRMTPSASTTVRGVCPATFGLKGQAPAAYNPDARLLFAPLTNLCMEIRPAAPRLAPGELALGATWQLAPGPGASLGRFIAWDPAVSAIRWEIREPLPLLGGALTTASGLVFYATSDGLLKAVDQVSGRELWRFTLPAPSVGSPMTYLGPDGRQYLAVLTGPGGWPTVRGLGAIRGVAWPAHQEGELVVLALPANGQP